MTKHGRKVEAVGDPMRALTTASGNDCPHQRIVECVIDVGQAISINASEISTLSKTWRPNSTRSPRLSSSEMVRPTPSLVGVLAGETRRTVSPGVSFRSFRGAVVIIPR